MPGSEVDEEHVNHQEGMINMLKSLVLRQGQLEGRMTSDGARGRASPALAANSKNECEPVGICQSLVLYA